MNHLRPVLTPRHPRTAAVGLLLLATTTASAQTGPVAVPDLACGDADLAGLTTRVYVAAAGTDRDGCGSTPENACAGIATGIARCAGQDQCGVLVRYGVYRLDAPIALADGVGVYGGCLPAAQADPRYSSVIVAPPQPRDRPYLIPPAIAALGIERPTRLYGWQVFGSAARVKREPQDTLTAAVRAQTSPGLVLDHVQLIGGEAGSGDWGMNGNDLGCGGQCGPSTAGCGSGGLASPDIWGRMSGELWQPSRAGAGGDGHDTGACRSHGGKGGEQGGPSFALLLVDSSVVARRLSVYGGRGGPGGPGGEGGDGPEPGGGGGGGNGGPAVGVALVGNSRLSGQDIAYFAGYGGTAGRGGAATQGADRGQGGTTGGVADTHSY